MQCSNPVLEWHRFQRPQGPRSAGTLPPQLTGVAQAHHAPAEVERERMRRVNIQTTPDTYGEEIEVRDLHWEAGRWVLKMILPKEGVCACGEGNCQGCL